MADANYPEDLLYHPEHDWARFDADDPLLATFGITRLAKDEPYCEVESVKAVSDVYAPLSGEIVEVNTALGETPDAINDDPYGDGWFVKVRLSDAEAERSQLLSQADYVASLQ